jgi:hypothetical protein
MITSTKNSFFLYIFVEYFLLYVFYQLQVILAVFIELISMFYIENTNEVLSTVSFVECFISMLYIGNTNKALFTTICKQPSNANIFCTLFTFQTCLPLF